MKPRFLTLVGMIALAAIARIMPHPWNATPVAAMALLAGASFDNKRTAFVIPLTAMLLGDIFLGFHALLPVVYLCFAVTVVIGFWIGKKVSVARVVGGSFAASVLFYVVTNAAQWVIDPQYAKTANGLLTCFVAAMPFFRSTVFGDLAYTALLFGAFQLATRTFPALREAA